MSDNSNSSDSGDQLANFFLYSLFVYPVANYIVAPQRKYPRWQAITYAIIFFMIVAYVHLVSENTSSPHTDVGLTHTDHFLYSSMKIVKLVLITISC